MTDSLHPGYVCPPAGRQTTTGIAQAQECGSLDVERIVGVFVICPKHLQNSAESGILSIAGCVAHLGHLVLSKRMAPRILSSPPSAVPAPAESLFRGTIQSVSLGETHSPWQSRLSVLPREPCCLGGSACRIRAKVVVAELFSDDQI